MEPLIIVLSLNSSFYTLLSDAFVRGVAFLILCIIENSPFIPV